MTTTSGISTGGKIFFSSLSAGTFGLGCWQLQRLYEKIDKIEDRQNQLQMPPSDDWKTKDHPYRQRLIRGSFRHDKEVLIGPRGSPPGVTLPRQGLSKNRTNQSGGLSPGPQGYFVLTPFEIQNVNDDSDSSTNMVWINRGWIPKTMVPQNGRKGGGTLTQTSPSWSRPTGLSILTTIQSSPEKPKIITPQHDYSKRPLQLFWFDPIALQAIAENDKEISLLTQVLVEDQNGRDGSAEYPLKPPVSSVAEFKTTPAVHAGYAVTWYGLSAAGFYMTRKLISRGRA